MSCTFRVVATAATLSILGTGPAIAHDGHAHPTATPSTAPAAPEAKPKPKAKAKVFFVQVYDIKEGQTEKFKRWVQEEGGPGLMAFPGVVSFETYVDQVSAGPLLKTIIGFEDYAALDRWYADPRMEKLLAPLDDLVGPHKHYIFRSSPLYRSKSLSYPPESAQ